MRNEWMAPFVILPFSVSCASHSSVAVHENRLNRAQAEAFPATSSGDAKGQPPTGKPKNSFSNLSFQKLVKSFKNLSNYFAFEEEEEEEEEEDEVEMEIGFPTDVQHVTHIGLDGLSRLDKAAPELLSLPSFSRKQFELQALAARSGSPPPPVGGSHGSWLH